MRSPIVLSVVLLLLVTALPVLASDEPSVLPERYRSFLQDGPGFLLTQKQRRDFLAMSAEERDALMEATLRDPIPGTPENELEIGVHRRMKLVRDRFLSPQDIRAHLLFLHGEPTARYEVECGTTFRPLEIWTYGAGESAESLVLYRPRPGLPFRLWLPLDSKRVLYTSEMEYWLEQYEELRGRLRAKRFDLQACPDTPKVDQATGVAGLFGFKEGRPTNQDFLDFVEPPDDLAAWARAAAATPLPEGSPELPVTSLKILFPERLQQRIVTRFLVVVPPDAPLEIVEPEKPGPEGSEKEADEGEEMELEGSEVQTIGSEQAEADEAKAEKLEVRIGIEGIIEQDGEVFDDFKVRFKLEPPEPGIPVALSMERALRPNREFVVRLRVFDEVGGAETKLYRGFVVPDEPEVVEEPPVPEGTLVALGEEIARRRIAGPDSLLLVPPEADVILGLWRAEALVTGTRIEKVVFLVDGEPQLAKTRPPFTAEVRLAKYPTEQVVRAEGYDAEGNLVAADEVIVNQPKGALRVRILEPKRGAPVAERVTARAEVVVPEERRVEKVEFLINDELIETRRKPPWEATLEVRQDGDITYLTVVAELDDGTRAEDVRFLRAPNYLEEINVNLVELYTTVTDGGGSLVRGLTQDDFRVFEDGRAQEIVKFELVEDLPLTVGFAIDTSGSMAASLPEAQKAAVAFLRNILKPTDQVFAIAFSDRPYVLMPPTDDISAVETALTSGLQSVGWTVLHDAVVTSLYYFRGIRGRRALILLSDGDDTASYIPFRDALEYARRSGVAIYTVGLDVSALDFKIKGKLKDLAQETGGRAFFIKTADELEGVYKQIEEELRSQYLLAYSSDRPARDGEFREVEVKVRGGQKARTIRGYYP